MPGAGWTEGSDGEASPAQPRVERCYALPWSIHGQPRIYTFFLEKFSPVFYAQIVFRQQQPPQTFQK